MTVKRVAKVLGAKLDTRNTPSSPYRPKITEIYAPPEPKPELKTDDLAVDLSAAGRLRNKKGMHRSMQDIQDSGLPDAIKERLITQRHNKQQIIRKISELQKAQYNSTLRADLRKQRVQMLQTEIMALESNYQQAIDELDALLTQQQFSAKQVDQVALLLLS